MAVGINTEANISAFVNTIFEDALLVARDNNLMANLVTVFNDRSGLAVRQNSQYGGATINTVAETDDLVSQTFTPSSVATLTPAEVGAQYFITDSRLESDPFPVRNDAALDLGQAVATKIETDLLGNFNVFTGGTVGASGTTLTWGYFFAMAALLKAQKAPLPYYFVCHPYQWHALGKAASIAAATSISQSPEFSNEVMRQWYVGSAGGIGIFVTSNVETASTDAYVGMFSRAALALDIRRAPRLEVERDASRRGFELNMSAVYAHGIWRPTFGAYGTFACSAPTS
jgi:hypothetical protein